jgi:Tfp pilus assembly protein PilZ
MTSRDAEHAAFLQISAEICGHKELPSILELIARQSLNCLKAHRSTIFLIEGKSGILKTHFTYAPDPLFEQVSLLEEKEVARKAAKQGKPLLLREPKDFSEFFKYEERERKVTSLLSIPLSSRSKSIGILSVVLINGDRRFNDKDLQFLSIFSNHVSIATEMTHLVEEVRKAVSSRKNLERYLDDILKQLQNISEMERQRIEEHIGRLLPKQTAVDMPTSEPPTGERPTAGEGGIALVKESGTPQKQNDGSEEMLRVEFEDSSWALAEDLTTGGAFIRTPNPLELGEQFLMKLHLDDTGEPTQVSCKVIWTNKYGKESKHLSRGMGIKFLNLDPEVQKRVENYVKSHPPKLAGDNKVGASGFKSKDMERGKSGGNGPRVS